MKRLAHQTTWEKVKPWYDTLVGQEGHYYHKEIIIPRLLKLWGLEKVETPSILDLACGQGVLARCLPKNVKYLGVDISPSLIKAAVQYNTAQHHQFQVADITKPLKGIQKSFTHASIILALQNLEHPEAAIKNAASFLAKSGQLTLVINHPYFRIPRQTSWAVDENKKIQYRRIDRYMSPLKIPVQAHPGNPKMNVETLSYHWPLSDLIKWLTEASFVVTNIEEWCSNKSSTGSKAKMENRARDEFPLFMTVVAKLAD